MSIQQSSYYPISQAPNDVEITATGSTTARTLPERFGETVKVADFGAVGDGTTNDTAAIQAAIDYAISLGGAIVEFQPKKYNLTSVFNNTVPNTMNTVNGYVSRHHLRITGGTTELKLFFKGNGSTLYTNVSPNFASNTIAQVIYTATDFNTIEFENLTIERGPARITDVPNWTFQEIGFGAFAVSNNQSKQLGFFNCTFINNTQFINGMWFYGGDSSEKLKQCVFSNCTWLYPYASNRTAEANGGGNGVCIYFDQWTENCLFQNCVVDMASSGSFPNDVAGLRDGFNVGNGVNTIWDHCVIKNCAIESIFSFGGQPDLPTLSGTITWPAEGQQVNVTLGANAINARCTYSAGDKLVLFEKNFTDRGRWRSGLFEFVSSTSTPFTTGTIITLKKLSDALLPPASFYTSNGPTVGATYNLATGNAWSLTRFVVQNKHKTTVTGCQFEGNKIRRQDGAAKLFYIQMISGGTGYTSPPNVVLTPSNGVTASASISGGQVTGITITNPNYFGLSAVGWFTQPPTISISGGNGFGATAESVLVPCLPSPAIWANNNCNISNSTFSNVGSAIFLKASIVRQGPNAISNNTFVFEENFDGNGFPNGSVGSLWHDFVLFNNNVILSSFPLNPCNIASRYGRFMDNLIVVYERFKNPTANQRSISAFSFLNTIKPCNAYFGNNYCINVPSLVFAQGGNSYILDSYKGSEQTVMSEGNSVTFKDITVDFRPKSSGWVRLNPLSGRAFLNRGTSAVYQIGGLCFSLSLSNSIASANIAVISVDKRLAISKIRVLAEGSVFFIEVYVPDHTAFDVDTYNTPISCKVHSEDGSGLISNPTSYQNITAIVADGSDALITCNNHGLRNGEYIYVNDSNSTPNINGTRQVTAVTTNTFKIVGITITNNGTSAEFLSTILNNNQPINITSISQNGSNVVITTDANNIKGEDPANGYPVFISGTNSSPSLDGVRTVTNTQSQRFEVAGITLTTGGTAAGNFIRGQDYATNMSVASQIDLNSATDIFVNNRIGIGSAQILSGTNAPTSDSPDGSIYLRTNGDSSTTVYVRSASTWSAIS